MKEKIKELLAKTQAFGPGGETMDRYNCSLYDLEKFAELIVRECLAQVDKVDEMLEDDSEKAGVAWVGYAIEKHFGVEE